MDSFAPEAIAIAAAIAVCFAVPGPLDAASSRACLALLRDYAGQVRVVAGIAELLEDLGLDQPDPGWLPGSGSGSPGSPERLGALESTVAAALVERAQTAGELAGHSGMPVAAVLGAITLLQARGLVVGVFGRYQATPHLLVRRPAPADRTAPDPA